MALAGGPKSERSCASGRPGVRAKRGSANGSINGLHSEINDPSEARLRSETGVADGDGCRVWWLCSRKFRKGDWKWPE